MLSNVKKENMGRVFLTILAVWASTAVNGQVTLKGLVKDNKGKPVAGASISLKETYDGATSDSSGRFSFRTTERVRIPLP